MLFDFIEEKHAEGAPLVEALLDAGIMRLRPVLITVGATVRALPIFYFVSWGSPQALCFHPLRGLGRNDTHRFIVIIRLFPLHQFQIQNEDRVDHRHEQ